MNQFPLSRRAAAIAATLALVPCLALAQGKEPVRHWCAGACGSLAAVAFSPDGRHLAYQGTRGLPEWRTGLGGVISVVELATRTPVELEAVASIPEHELAALHGVGPVALATLRKALAEHGLGAKV